MDANRNLTRLGAPPEQPYERQLAHGFADLRFESPLETEYRGVFAREQRRPALIFGAIAMIIWTGFAAFDFVRLNVVNQGIGGADVWVLIGARWAALLVIAAFYLSPLRDRANLELAAFVIYVTIAFVAAMNAIIYKSHGIAAAESALVIVVMAPFLPIGLTFYRALAAAFVPALTAAILGTVLLDTDHNQGLAGQILVLAIAIPVGAIGGYMREYAHRRQFLLTAVLSRHAQFDPLTDLANRRLFQRHADAVIAHAVRHDEPLVLAMLDIDHFKRFNDRFGHAAGDQALRMVADTIATAARRPMDMATRLGGEEFALLLHASSIEQAIPILENLRQQISDLMVPNVADAEPLTVSIGATGLTGRESLADIYDRADRLLYASKADGRDRLSIG